VTSTPTGSPDTPQREPADQARPAQRFAPDFLTEMFRNPLDAGYAEAAARRQREGADSPARLRWGRLARTIVLLVIGFLLAVAYHQTVAAKPESARVHDNLVKELKSSRTEADNLQRDADVLRSQVAAERDAALAGTGIDPTELTNLEVAAGLAEVKGDGAVVRLGDAPQPVDPVTGQPSTKRNLGKVLDLDLQAVANELWHQGAEAIAINGERLTSTSTIRTAGTTILVDFRPLSSPYEVVAIGPGDLDKKFSRSITGQKFAAYADQYGMSVSVKHRSKITMPGGPEPELIYAHPVPTGSPSPTAPASPTTPPTGRQTRPASPAPTATGGR
jgi:uncharacterized protein YlxW (UPF0749 family)